MYLFERYQDILQFYLLRTARMSYPGIKVTSTKKKNQSSMHKSKLQLAWIYVMEAQTESSKSTFIEFIYRCQSPSGQIHFIGCWQNKNLKTSWLLLFVISSLCSSPRDIVNSVMLLIQKGT